jgi:hypothetical protein
MLFWEIIAVYSENHTKHGIHYGQNAEFINVKADGAYSNHCALTYKAQCLVYVPAVLILKDSEFFPHSVFMSFV